MTATYDEQGNYVYPEGFDSETNEWLPGFDKAREEWERQYAEAQARFDAHRKQVEEARKAEAVAGVTTSEAGAPSTYSSAAPEDASGTLASDEALAALREKLTGGA
jgi:small subunit ribosomal protein S1